MQPQPHAGVETNPTPWPDAARPVPVPPEGAGPSFPGQIERGLRKAKEQSAMDEIDEASMESFPASDPPAYIRCHA